MKETVNKLTKHKTEFKKLEEKITNIYGRCILIILVGTAVILALLLMGMEMRLEIM
jgi:hypothetical protein